MIPVETTKQDLNMLFVTDGSIVGRGFHFTYEVYNGEFIRVSLVVRMRACVRTTAPV